jgi:predicted ABC-type ATPase
MQAGRVMLNRIDQLTALGMNVAFESTLASRSFAAMIKRLAAEGYRFHLLFLSLPSADMAVNRVRERVTVGGHHVPEDVIRRRYAAGLRNFFQIYAPLAFSWRFYDNSLHGRPRLVAEGSFGETRLVLDQELWDNLTREWI